MPKDRTQFPPLASPLGVPIADSHTHLDSIAPYVERVGGVPPQVSSLLASAFAVGVDRLVQCGCDLPAARWTDEVLRSQTVSSEQAALLGAIAIHPNEAVLHAGVREIAADGLAPNPQPWHEIPLDQAITEIANLAAGNPRIRSIGETGMDLFRAGPNGEKAQRESFRAHIALAKELNLALQIHDRDAHEQVIEVLLKDGAPERTVFHCFSGNAQMAEFCAAQGWYLSFAGPVTYKANEELRAALRVTPLELLLVETDAPYLTPHPYRGQPNAPAAANYTVRAIAEYRFASLDSVCRALSANSETVFGPF
ncbi:MAG: TatD family hydrolase [Cellulomonadaceae bacterium]|jgi:TatD DNase family protein|nr:TatD family hydrolase [Cellulomonadaceae bacterium]